MVCDRCGCQVSFMGEVLVVFFIYIGSSKRNYRRVNLCYKCNRLWGGKMRSYGYFLYSK